MGILNKGVYKIGGYLLRVSWAGACKVVSGQIFVRTNLRPLKFFEKWYNWGQSRAARIGLLGSFRWD